MTLSTFRCPTCGDRLDIAEIVDLTERQRAIRDAIEIIHRDNGRAVRTWQIAQRVQYSDRMVRYDLAILEGLGIIHRPNGPKSGWALRRSGLALVRAA